MELLFEAKKRFGLSILNFTVTSNHIHLIVSDSRGIDVIPQAMHLIAGRTGQEYNRRKRRKGAFWEDRYHATAIESGDHLWRCMVYVDLNMVRASVVDHPSKWKWSGYTEIQNPKERYQVIDHDLLRRFLFVETNVELAEIHRRWVESEMLKNTTRQEKFSKAIAVGSENFVKKVSEQLGARAIGRTISENTADGYQLRESISRYQSDGECRKVVPDTLLDLNMVSWNGDQSLEW